MRKISTGPYFYIANTYSSTYATTAGSRTRSEMLVAVFMASIMAIVLLPYIGDLTERHGRRKLILIGLAGMGVWIFSLLWAFNSGQTGLVVLALMIGPVRYEPAVLEAFYGIDRLRLTEPTFANDVVQVQPPVAAIASWPTDRLRCSPSMSTCAISEANR